MPTISIFYGIVIQMFWTDHAPPHFHALYAEFEAQLNIQTLEIINGNLPKRALSLVLEWASEHRAELIEDWELCTQMEKPKKISPLQIMPQIIAKAPWRITEVRVLSSYTLWVKFNDGIEGTVSLSGLVHSQHAGVFAALRDEKLFMQVALKYGAVTWPGELDLAPDAMYEAIRSDGAWILN